VPPNIALQPICSAALRKRLNATVRVRHEVVQVAVTTEDQDVTQCSAIGILPRHASPGKPSPKERWWGVKPSGQKYPTPFGVAMKS